MKAKENNPTVMKVAKPVIHDVFEGVCQALSDEDLLSMINAATKEAEARSKNAILMSQGRLS